jgi:hypothetical protein
MGYRTVTQWVFAGFFALALFGSGHAIAGTISGKIATVVQRSSDGLTYVVIDGTPSGRPACASNTYWMIADENSEAGKKQFAMLLAAWAGGLEIKIVGRNSCLRWSDGEDINYIQTL